MIEALHKKIKSGDKRALAKAITLIESTRKEDRKDALTLLTKIDVNSSHSLRIGISGIPGVGKSTFIEKLGLHILEQYPSSKIAILTIDPSSPIEGGSILADRLRMTQLSNHPHVFIRPSPSSGSQGGLSRRTRESMILLESSGFDFIFVETAGVGQTEYSVASLVDIFLLLQMPSTGDEWQAMKKGILELADILIVNKTDGNLKSEAIKLKKILQLSFATESSSPSIFSCSSLLDEGIDEILMTIIKKIEKQKSGGDFVRKRTDQTLFWFKEELIAHIKQEIECNPEIKKVLSVFKNDLLSKEASLFSIVAEKAAKKLLREEFHL